MIPRDINRSPNEMSPLLHTQEPQGMRPGLGFIGDTFAIIADCQNELAGLFVRGNVNSRCICMAQNIGQSLLKNRGPREWCRLWSRKNW